MNNLLDKIIDFFRDKSVHVSFRVSLALAIMLFLFVINDYLRWSHYHKIDSQLQQIIILKQIDSNVIHNDTTISRKFTELKKAIVYDTSFFESAIVAIKNTKLFNSGKEINRKIKTHDQKSENTTNSQSYNSINWFDITAMLFTYVTILILSIALLVTLFAKSDTLKNKLSIVVGIIIFILLMYGVGRIYTSGISLIPIFNPILINYTINIIGQILIISALRFFYTNNK